MSTHSPARRFALAAGLLAVALISCGREITGPVATPVNAFKRFASLAFSPQYETAVRGGALQAALLQVAFERVRITLRREDGTIALDTVVDFPAGADSLTLSLLVPLAANAPAGGVLLSLNLGYVNAAGDTVFKGGPLPVTVLPSTGGAPPPPVQVPVHYTGTGASATAVSILPKVVAGLAGQSAAFSAQALSSGGQTIAGTPIVFSSSNSGVVRIDNPSSGNAVLVGRGTAKVYAQLLTGPIDSAVVTVTLPAAALSLVSGGNQTAPAGATLPLPIVARVAASDGIGVGGVTVNFAATSGGGSVTPASVVSAADGSVSAAWTLGGAPGAQSLTLTVAGLSGSPLVVNATALSITPTRLAVTTQPSNAKAGATLGNVTVAAQDASGVTVATFTGDVTVALGANPGGATLGGTTTVRAVNGVATFSNLSLNRPGTAYTLVFASSGLSGMPSSSFDVTSGNAAKLAFGPVTSTADAGIAMGSVQVTTQDSAGNAVTSFTGAVTVAIGNNPGTSTLSGTLTRTAVAGVATFNDLSLNRKGAAYTLVATATGLTSGTSAAFNVAPGAPTGITVVSGGGQTAAAGAALTPIVLKLRDALGNGISDVTISLAVTSGGGSLGASSAVTDADGLVTVSWTLGGASGAQSITATATGVPTTTITATATGGASNQLVITGPPSATQTAGVTFSPGVSVSAKDAANALLTAFTGTVTVSVSSGPAGATLGGTTSVNAVGGVATFSALRLTKAGTYTLRFASTGLASVITASFTVGAAPAKTIAADSGNAQTGTAGAALAQKLVVLVTDSLGNPVSGTAVMWAVASGGGSIDSTATVTNAAGRTRVKLTLGLTAGSNSATATSTGLTGSPVAFSATGVGTVVSTTVTPQLDTIVSLNATFALTAQSRDAATNPIAGNYAWVSRTPATATVSAAGLVTAIANGSTWVVATEAGGTRDSALIVVQQRVATINVTPGTRSIYKSRSFQFAASAVDGMGNVVPGVTSFTWSTLSPAVATVDTTGKVIGVTLGSTQVRATSGAITGVASVSILTPITRIIVGRDSSGVPVADSTALPSLGIGRFFRAEARDTLDAVMTGVTFTWFSTNGSVALMDSITATRARALTNANGTTTIQATADGITGSAALKVQQVLAAIELTPTPDTIGIAGTVQLTARGKDANSRYISGGTFTYASGTPAVATVSVGGAVTGVSLGSSNITATSGAITSNPAVVVVSTTVPPIISFGRDTLTVGRGSSTSIPIFLSRPNASIVTVTLAARDTNAYFSVASVNIPVGTTAVNVTLNGRNAGTTQIYATDGSGTGFTGDTAAVAVQANMRLAQTSWYLNATDQVASQVLLSDPSPAGGTFVTFAYGTAGRAQVSPDPAFIPTGQLASNIVITALGLTSGSTTITPVATGVNGTASTLNISAPVLTISAGASARLGAGQYEGGWYAYTPQYTTVSVPLTYTSSNTSVVTVAPATGAIPTGSNYQYFTVNGIAPGTASVIVSSPGWKPDTLLMTITSPRTTISASTSLITTSPIANATVYATDSLGSGHYRTSSLALTISSSDTNVIRIIDKTPTIAAGQYYASGIRYQPGGTGGTAYIKVVAGGHVPDSILVTVVGPKLQFSWFSNQVGKGQYDQNLYVYTPNNVVAPLVVTLANSDAAKATVPASVTVPTGTNYVYFNVSGLDTGVVTFLATAPGYQPDTATYRISSPRVTISGGGTFNNFRAPVGFTVYSTDSVGSGHYRSTPLVVSYRSTNTAALTVDSATATIVTGLYYHNTARVSFIGIGTAYLVVEASGHRPDSVLYTVQTPKLNFSFTSALIGRRQRFTATDFYVYTPDSRASSVPVTITQTRPSSDSLTTTTPTIAAAINYQYFGAFGLTLGVDTLIASASGYLPDTAFIRVGPQRLTVSGLPGTALTTNSPSSVNLYATDSIGTAHYVMDTVVVQVTSSDTTVIKPTLRYVRIPPGQYYVASGYSYFGPGTANLTFTDSAGSGYGSVITNSVTVTGPSLIFSSTSAMYGMRQRGSSTDYYVYTQNNVASATTVNLLSTDTRVATVPASVTIPAGLNYAYFTMTAQDTVGTIQVQATAVGFGPPTPINVQVTQPRFVLSVNTSARTTQGPQTITLYATDANGTSHYTTENVTVTLASSSGAVAGVDSSTITIPAGAYYHNTSRWLPVSVGSAQISATDARAAIYKYNTGTANVSVTTPKLSFSWNSVSLGLGQYIDNNYDGSYYVYTPDYQAAPLPVTLTHVGAARVTTLASVTIPTSPNYQYIRLTGALLGTDTLVATASSPFHNADTAYTVVDSGRVDGIVSWPATSMRVGDSVAVTLRTLDPNASSIRRVAAATTFTLAPNASIEFRSGGAGSTTITSVTVPADGSQVTFYVKALVSGSGVATITNANYRTYTPPSVTVIP